MSMENFGVGLTLFKLKSLLDWHEIIKVHMDAKDFLCYNSRGCDQ